jgi:hypothetical protein
MKRTTRVCSRPGCGTRFIPRNPCKKYCGDQCAIEARHENSRKWYWSHRERALERQKEHSHQYRPPASVRRNNVAKVQIAKAGYTRSDIMHAPAEKAARMLNRVILGLEVLAP